MSGRFNASQLDRLATAVMSSTGLVFPRTRRSLLHRAALEGMAESGVADREEFVRLACSDARWCARLAALATVGETYLFRYAEQLAEVRSQVIEPLVAERSREAKPSVRVWSAGCSGGEEAYTLAILLAEAVGDRARWDIRVVGTDLNGDALTRARRGTYGPWAMRGSWSGHKRWLEPTDEGVRVAPEIRRLVTFEEHNLATLPVLPLALRGVPIDLIVCRNVMIYLHRSVVARLVDGFHRSLANGGWLVVAPVETSVHGLPQRFEARPSAAGTLYRRPHAEGDGRVSGSRASSVPTARIPRVAAQLEQGVGALPLPGTTQTRRPDVHQLLTAARSLADSGRLPEARNQCLELLRRFPASVEGHLLLASIAEGQDDLDGAFDSLRRTLYLDPGNASAQFSLGLLEWRRKGTKRAAARLLRAAQLVEGHADDEILDSVHQLTAGRLRSVVEALVV